MANEIKFSYKLDTSVLQKLIVSTPQRASQWLRSVAQEIVDDIKLSFGTGAKGRTYMRGTVAHTASAPGSPPAVDIGTLKGSIHFAPDGENRYIISDGVEYGAYLEMGTEHIEKRPFFGPVFQEWATSKLLESAKDAKLIE